MRLLMIPVTILLCQSLAASSEDACISDYEELKASLLRRHCNRDALITTFYPNRELRPSAVDIFFYHVPRSVDIGKNASCNAWQQVIQGRHLSGTHSRWFNSPTLRVADLHVLEHMSFMRLAVVEDTIEYIILDPFCDGVPESKRVAILKTLTVFVSTCMSSFTYRYE